MKSKKIHKWINKEQRWATYEVGVTKIECMECTAAHIWGWLRRMVWVFCLYVSPCQRPAILVCSLRYFSRGKLIMCNSLSLCVKDMYCWWVCVGNAEGSTFLLNSIILFTYTHWNLIINVALSALEIHVCMWWHREILGTECWVAILHGLIIEIPEFSFSVSWPPWTTLRRVMAGKLDTEQKCWIVILSMKGHNNNR